MAQTRGPHAVTQSLVETDRLGELLFRQIVEHLVESRATPAAFGLGNHLGARGETHRGSECVIGARDQGPKPQLYRAYYKVSGHRDRAPRACSGS